MTPSVTDAESGAISYTLSKDSFLMDITVYCKIMYRIEK